MRFTRAAIDGVWRDTEIHAWRDDRGHPLRLQSGVVPLEAIGMTRPPVYLATAHLNHDPTFNGLRWRSLAALCQRGHMIHDGAEHRRPLVERLSPARYRRPFLRSVQLDGENCAKARTQAAKDASEGRTPVALRFNVTGGTHDRNPPNAQDGSHGTSST